MNKEAKEAKEVRDNKVNKSKKDITDLERRFNKGDVSAGYKLYLLSSQNHRLWRW
ncbi:hypothetical protein ACROAH_22500 [Shewanella oncorhynchi]|uniref:hypothetical protein n=1 Tax=Shewanella oncorhynchi TaxID=2726434 RepID=UPI003D7983F3